MTAWEAMFGSVAIICGTILQVTRSLERTINLGR